VHPEPRPAAPAPAAGTHGSPYRPDLDGLRAVAVLAVLVHHLSSAALPGGFVGVDVFFVISGFLITGIVLRELAAGTFSIGRFYERRVRRLFPALFAMLAALLVAGWFLLLPSDYLATLRATAGTLLFSSNLVFWRDLAEGYFAADAKLNPLLHTWSLGVEEQFYLLFPAALLLAMRHARTRLPLLLAVAALASFLLGWWWLRDHPVAVFFLLPFRAWELLVGALLAVGALRLPQGRMQREALATLGLAAILASAWLFDGRTPFPGPAALAPVLGAAAVIHAGGAGPTAVGALLCWRPAVYIGLISYSLYLWHWPLIVLARFANGMDPMTPWLPALFVASIALASLSYHFVEKPFRRPGGMPRARLFARAALASGALLALAIGGIAAAGVPSRHDAQTLAFDAARRPPIPFRDCEGAIERCRLGARDVAPTVLLWGDSHALAWAPALDRALAARGLSARFAFHSGCAPLPGLRVRDNAGCLAGNAATRAWLEVHPEVDTVLLSAFWTLYYREGIVVPDSDRDPAGTVDAALAGTLAWLAARPGRHVLLADVPSHGKDVPLSLALRRITGRASPAPDLEQHAAEQAPFLAALRAAGAPAGRIALVDPAPWMCRPECVQQAGGVSLYRDAHHLSVPGALHYADRLAGQALSGGDTGGSDAALTGAVAGAAPTTFKRMRP
jgi:peptidoglycan/LPS O-acetylase OafA/YrhL